MRSYFKYSLEQYFLDFRSIVSTLNVVFSWSQTIWSPAINTAISAETGNPAIISINWPQSDMSLMDPVGLGPITLTSINLGTGETAKYLVQDHMGKSLTVIP